MKDYLQYKFLKMIIISNASAYKRSLVNTDYTINRAKRKTSSPHQSLFLLNMSHGFIIIVYSYDLRPSISRRLFTM